LLRHLWRSNYSTCDLERSISIASMALRNRRELPEPQRECSDFFHKPQGQRPSEYARRRAMAKPGRRCRKLAPPPGIDSLGPALRVKDSGMAAGKGADGRDKSIEATGAQT
jgi:hypothetical protein